MTSEVCDDCHSRWTGKMRLGLSYDRLAGDVLEDLGVLVEALDELSSRIVVVTFRGGEEEREAVGRQTTGRSKGERERERGREIY